MEWNTIWAVVEDFFSAEHLLYLLEEYRDLGPLPGILLPMIEALMPFLPLVVIIAGNAAAYGFWFGFLFSWIGAVFGSLIVFLIFRRLARQRFMGFISRHPKVLSMLDWFERHGFGMIFLLLCFPFTPSSLINVVAGLSKINVLTFSLAVILGKMVMISVVAFVGHDIVSLVRQPEQLVVLLLAMAILWMIGKYIEMRLTKRRVSPDTRQENS